MLKQRGTRTQPLESQQQKKKATTAREYIMKSARRELLAKIYVKVQGINTQERAKVVI